MRRLVSLGFALLPLIGCGSGTSQPAETTAAWQEEANASCAETRAQVEALPITDDPDQTAESLEETNRLGRAWLMEMQEVDVPAEHRAAFSQMLDHYRMSIGVQDRAIPQARRGAFDSVVQTLAEVNEWGDRGDEIARELGLDECAKDPDE